MQTKKPKQVINITLELEPKVHAGLERLAAAQSRSKRKQAAIAVADAVKQFDARKPELSHATG